MSVFHDEVEIEDMEYESQIETYFYPCPCGDRFQITKVPFIFGNTFLFLFIYIHKLYRHFLICSFTENSVTTYSSDMIMITIFGSWFTIFRFTE